MFTKRTIMPGSWIVRLMITMSVFIMLSGGIAMAGEPVEPDLCGNNYEFTTDFRIEDCKFKTKGENPYFILRPGYRVVLESDEEKSVETVLEDTKRINLDGRRIRTRVLEERAFEWEEGEDGDEGEWKTIEISLNYFAICKKTNAVYYFGEWSRDCEEGFDEDDNCPDGVETNAGSWEAGVNGAIPGLMMPGTPLLGAKYFQEIASDDGSVDRGEIAAMGLSWPEEGETEFTDCIKIFDTNPAEVPYEEACEEEDPKIYCPGIGIVQDQDLVLVSYGYDDDDDDDDDDNDKKGRRW